MTHEQCAELAELYAVGALDESDRLEVDAHARSCPSCARVLGDAERDVAFIASMQPQKEAPHGLSARIERILQPARSAWLLPGAIAAALIVGLFPSVYFWSENAALHRTMLSQDSAIQRLANAPHRVARFRAIGSTPSAEVIYGSDGSWYLVVVRGASKPFSVAWMHGGDHIMLGDAVPRGNVATLYLPKSHRMDLLALMDGNRIIAEATLSWQKKVPSHQGGRSA